MKFIFKSPHLQIFKLIFSRFASRNFFHPSLIFLNLFLLSSCAEKDPGYTYLPEDFKAYGFFKKGSTWTYRNEKTFESCYSYVTNEPKYTYYQSGEFASFHEECTVVYGGSLLKEGYLATDYYNLQIGIFHCPCLKYEPFDTGVVYNISSGKIEKHHLDSLKINDLLFKDVLLTKVQKKYNDDTINFELYLVKKVGLIKFIKRQKNTDTTWSLSSYHIVE